MKCLISCVALASSVLSLANAVSVDYYPHDPHAHPAHVKYIEPTHVKPVKYIQPAPIAPVYKHISPVKYIHQEPHHVKYVDDSHHVKYIDNPHYVKHVEYDAPAEYEFGYDVHDPHTGDVKSHSEKSDGNGVHGRYEVLDPDGFKRIVEYTADEHNGFNAVVRREPTDVKIIKKVYQPELVKHVTPIAPIAPVKYFTPQHEAIVAAPPKYVAPKIVAPIVKQYTTPQYYAAPENPKFYGKPLEKITKIVKPAYDYDPHHTDVKYVSPAPYYNHY